MLNNGKNILKKGKKVVFLRHIITLNLHIIYI